MAFAMAFRRIFSQMGMAFGRYSGLLPWLPGLLVHKWSMALLLHNGKRQAVPLCRGRERKLLRFVAPPCPIQCHRMKNFHCSSSMTLNGAWGFGVDIEWGMGVTHRIFKEGLNVT